VDLVIEFHAARSEAAHDEVMVALLHQPGGPDVSTGE